MVDYIKSFISLFTTITTAIIVLVAIIQARLGYDAIPEHIIFEILGVAVFASLLSQVILSKETKSKKQYVLLSLFHYVVLCVVMTALGVWLEWISLNFGGILLMTAYVAVVYIITYAFMYILAKRDADEFNREISKRKNKTEISEVEIKED